MKQTPNEYAEMLIDKYLLIKTVTDICNLEEQQAIQCAINDVNNTIEVLNLTPYFVSMHLLDYYTEVLNILKSKL